MIRLERKASKLLSSLSSSSFHERIDNIKKKSSSKKLSFVRSGGSGSARGIGGGSSGFVKDVSYYRTDDATTTTTAGTTPTEAAATSGYVATSTGGANERRDDDSFKYPSKGYEEEEEEEEEKAEEEIYDFADDSGDFFLPKKLIMTDNVGYESSSSFQNECFSPIHNNNTKKRGNVATSRRRSSIASRRSSMGTVDGGSSSGLSLSGGAPIKYTTITQNELFQECFCGTGSGKTTITVVHFFNNNNNSSDGESEECCGISQAIDRALNTCASEGYVGNNVRLVRINGKLAPFIAPQMGLKRFPALVALGSQRKHQRQGETSAMNFWEQQQHKQTAKVVGTKVVLDKLFDFHMLGLCSGDDEWDADYIADWIETNLS